MKRHVILAAMVAAATLFVSQKLYSQEKPAAFGKKQKEAVIASLLQKLTDEYIFPDIARKAGNEIRSYQKKGIYNKINDPKTLADSLNAQLKRIVKDKHLGVWYNPNQPLPVPAGTVVDKEREEKFMRHMRRVNLGLPKLDILEGNVGYLKIEGFGPVDKVGETVTGAMMFLANTEALIIDLRGNRGGEPELVQHVASYFFGDNPVHINSLFYRKNNELIKYYTLPVKGRKYLDKPVYVLTDSHTFSAGEELAYDLQTQKRAILVGETTGGGANPGDQMDLGNGFFAFIPTGRAINPVTQTNWEGVGVIPDIKTAPEDALTKAHQMALEKLLETAPDQASMEYYGKNLEAVKKK